MIVFSHKPVLFYETVDGLNVKPDGTYVDCTLGGAGHSSLLLSRLTTGKLIAFDQDPAAIENAKVRLCRLMLKEINLLVLDEPTNHLDVMAKDELKKAVSQFRGTVILVSHEPEFYEDIVDEVINLENLSNKCV